jgi:hypothetical protein
MLGLDAIRIALQRDRTIFDVGQYVGRHSAVEIDNLPLSKAGFRIDYFINVRKSEFFVADFDGQRSHKQILSRRWADAIAKCLVKHVGAPSGRNGLIEAIPFMHRCLAFDFGSPVSIAPDSTRKLGCLTHGPCH